MKTPVSSNFEYLNGRIENSMQPGRYRIVVGRENNVATRDVKTFIVIRELRNFGGNYNIVGKCYFFLAFMLMMASLTLTYLHRLKFKGDRKDRREIAEQK